jgi:hypothetical protein
MISLAFNKFQIGLNIPTLLMNNLIALIIPIEK